MSYELRSGLRLLGRAPGFAVTAALTLGVGIGAVTAMFSVVDRVLIHTVSYPDADRLLVVWNRHITSGERLMLAPGDSVDFRDRTRVFEAFGAGRPVSLALTGAGEPEQLDMARVTAGVFDVLDVPPLVGRTFTAEEDRPGGPAVAVVSARLARRLFQDERRAIGRTLTIEAQPREVIGVMADGFQFPAASCDVWLPLGWGQAELRRGHNFIGVARLKPGVTIEQAQTDVQTIARDLAMRFPDSNRQIGAYVEPLRHTLTGAIRPALLVLLAAVALVLLMSCANVANLLLARASARRRDMAVRLALGASRASIVRLWLMESLPIALIGAAAGLLIASTIIGGLRSLIPANVPGAADIGMNGRVMLFTFGLSLVTCLLVALAPALRASDADAGQHLKDSARTTGDRAGQHVRNVLVIAQVALATVLLVSAGLLIESFRRVSGVDAGFHTDGLVTMAIALPARTYTPPARAAAFYRDLLERVDALPGVAAAGIVNRLPLGGQGSSGPATAEGTGGAMRQFGDVGWRATSADYFRVMGIPLLKGRAFTDADRADRPGVVIVDDLMAKAFWPNDDPIGKRLKLGLADWSEPWLTVVGVVRHVRHAALDAEPAMQLYWPFEQRPEIGMVLVARAHGDPWALVPALRAQVLAVDPNQPVARVATMDRVREGSLASKRFTMLVLGVFAALALVIASMGIYGLMAYVVSLRRREIGVRMALGATRGDVLGSVLRDVLMLTAAGLVIGAIATAFTQRLIAGLLYGVHPFDPVVLLTVAAGLLLAAITGGLVPALRAARTPAMVVLRSE